MSPLLRKEIRMLLPAWIGALVAATMPFWLWGDFKGIAVVLGGAAILGLALSPFGQEMSFGTFGLLLVQPEERRRLWRIKTRLLAVALASTFVLFNWCLGSVTHNDNGLDISFLLTILAFSGGLWSTLLLRDRETSFICAGLAPTIICAVTLATLGHWIDPESDRFAIIVYLLLIAYAVTGFFWARRLFLDAQDVPWTGGQISLRAGRSVSLRWLAFEFKDRQNRWTALVKRELQLQEVTMFVIPVLILLHLAALGAHHFFPHWISQEVISEAVPMLWAVVVPFLIGCVAVAEERRLNTLEGLLCLSISKGASFAVKFGVVLVLGAVLGGIIPWILAHLGGAWIKSPRMPQPNWQTFEQTAVLVAAMAFYASTMSRGLLQAIPTTVCASAVMWLAILAADKLTSFESSFDAESIFFMLAWKTMTITFVWLAFKNYKSVQIGWRVWAGNMTRAGAVFGCTIVTAVVLFERPWELFIQLEPIHGPARISGAGKAAIGAWDSGLSAMLPDGRLWIGKMDPDWKSVSGGFVPGSNWVAMAANGGGAMALQSGGTLWRISNRADIRQIGPASDWKKIVSDGDAFLALKQDGTIWGWGVKQNGTAAKTPRVDPFVPVRIGEDSDWADAFIPAVKQVVGVKRDGNTQELGHLQNANRWELPGTNWLSITRLGNLTLGISRDGSLWGTGWYKQMIFGNSVSGNMLSGARRIGTKSDWVALSREGNGQIDALEADGALWTMKYNESRHPSKYTDWLAATEDGWFTFALARDGTVSCWADLGVYTEHIRPATFMGKDILGPTRRPIFSANILDAQH